MYKFKISMNFSSQAFDVGPKMASWKILLAN